MYVVYLEYKVKWYNVISKNMVNLKKRKKKYRNGVFVKEKIELELIVLQMFLIFERNSRKEKRFRRCLVDDIVIELIRIFDGRKYENQWVKSKVC